MNNSTAVATSQPAQPLPSHLIDDTVTEVPSLVPIKDDTPVSDAGYDKSDGKPFNLTRLLGLLSDVDDQPNWRRRADLACAFVDGKQFTAVQEAALIAEGMEDVRPTNLIGRVVRSICGSEAKARTDIKVDSDDDETADVTDYLNGCMKEAQRETYADMAVSDSYFGQVAAGVGWVEVSTNTDPLAYPDRVSSVHRSEMFWDFKAKDVIARDARWQCRVRWADLDELEAAMPKHRLLLRQVAGGWASLAQFDSLVDNTERTRAMVDMQGNETRWSEYRRRTDWYDGARKRVKLYEVHYKVPAIGVILHLSKSRKLLFDPQNQMHVMAVASGKVKVTKQLTTQIRMSLFAGPHRLMDIGTAKRNFPYVPFFAYRDDEDMSPYGLVEGMISPQTEYNARRIRINWLLRARQLILDNDALDEKANSLSDIADQINRPDLTVVLDANRKNKTATAFQVGNNLGLEREQVEVMQDAKQLIQDVPGVYGSQLGQAASGVTSGIANSLLIEQGAVAMGDLNDNYRHSRRMVFELLLQNQIDRYKNEQLQVLIGRGSAKRVIVLNQWDPRSETVVNNVADASVRVGLGEVPNTPSFRQQQQQQIALIIQALAGSSPQAVAVLAPSFIEATDLPDRMERADDLRKATGIPTAGDRKAAAEQEAAMKQEQAKQKAIQEAAIHLGMEEKAADINKTKSETELNIAKAVQIGNDLALSHVETLQTAEADPDAARQALIDDAMAEAGAPGLNSAQPPQQPQQQPEMAAA